MRYQQPPQKTFDYNGLIYGTLRTVWRHKFLWLLGLFAGGLTSFGGWDCNYSSYTTDESGRSYIDRGAGVAGSWVAAHQALFVALLLVALAAGILFFLFSILCQGAIINAVRDLDAGRPAGLGAAFRAGRESFRRLLAFNLFMIGTFLVFAAVAGAVIAGLVLLSHAGPGGQTAAAIIGTILLAWLAAGVVWGGGYFAFLGIPVALTVGLTLFLVLASRAVVIGRAAPLEAVRRTFRLLLASLSRCLLLFLLSTGLSIGAFIVMGFVAVLSGIIALIAWVLVGAAGFPWAGIVIAAVLTLPVPAAVLTALGAFNGYLNAFWTGVYLRLAEITPIQQK